ncbi:hypothetical protein KM1_047740 [Entamoeba histolytica HM-3:IMSS]|uniref:Uncharacterized protein n=3 Tax=Entamoeba histolytica TaxID=5759 RepID=M7X219_ENTHI|nr:hypothetical protein KM1_047740 [Entamoeba histolytica HM-3:IMSS]
MNMSLSHPQAIMQPIAKAQISIDSTSTSFADEIIIIDDYMQREDCSYPQRTINPIPFERTACLPFGDDYVSSASQSQTSSLAEGLYWLNKFC